MNLKDFGKALWRSYLLSGFIKPLTLIFICFLCFGFIDFLLRLGILWRAMALACMGLVLFLRYRTLRLRAEPPKQEELVQLACRLAGDDALLTPADQLTLPKAQIGTQYRKKAGLLCLALGAVLCVPEGRIGFKRLFFLQGEWNKRTRIVDVDVPEYVEEGSPIKVVFRTEGRVPALVRFSINNVEKKIVRHSKSDRWSYDFFHEPGDITISIEAGDDSVSNLIIKVVPAPRLTSSKIIVTEPVYLGGDETIIEGLTARISQGSKVTLVAAFDSIERVESPEDVRLGAENNWVLDLGQVTEDTTSTFKGRPHVHLPVSNLATFRLLVNEDIAPQLLRSAPLTAVTTLVTGRVDLKYLITDDHALEKFELLIDGEVYFSKKIDLKTQVLKHTLLLADLDLSKINQLEVHARARDSNKQWGEAPALIIRIVDAATYKLILMEEHQRIHLELEKLLQSMTRRHDRHKAHEKLEREAEMSALRTDTDRIESLTDKMKKYGSRLKEIDDLAKLSEQNDKNQRFLAANTKGLLEDMMRNNNVSLRRQKGMIDKLAEISKEMAEAEDFHLVIQILDQMIVKERNVIKNIPE